LHKLGASLELSKHKIGDKISLRNLVKYAITVSDNTAHEMLVDYIGKNNLRDFGKSLGATTTLNSSDDFGNINNIDSMIYIEALNNLINESGQLGEELKAYFVESDQNYLQFESLGIKAAQKYGEYDVYYHSNGIVYDENPYFISILTLHGKNKFEKITRDINEKIYELHTLFYENRVNVCYKHVYEKEEG
jgi:hypothetical protein